LVSYSILPQIRKYPVLVQWKGPQDDVVLSGDSATSTTCTGSTSTSTSTSTSGKPHPPNRPSSNQARTKKRLRSKYKRCIGPHEKSFWHYVIHHVCNTPVFFWRKSSNGNMISVLGKSAHRLFSNFTRLSAFSLFLYQTARFAYARIVVRVGRNSMELVLHSTGSTCGTLLRTLMIGTIPPVLVQVQ